MTVLGSPIPKRLGVPADTDADFPDSPGTYTSSDGAIIVPGGALDRWFQWRATGGTERRELVAFGDSTTFGSGGSATHYSWLQRIRERAVGFGLLDGGKGMFGGLENIISYDPPEVNGWVSQTFTGTNDGFDNLTGNYFADDGDPVGGQLNLQFRSTAVRLWYSARNTAGTFTYSVDGGAPVTVNAFASPSVYSRFIYISGLAAGVTHTIAITNTGTLGQRLWVALAPMNDSGLSVQKFARSGATFMGFFFAGVTPSAPYTQSHDGFFYQTPLGLSRATVSGPNYSGMTVDTIYAQSERVKPILAISHLGFNDLTSGVPAVEVEAWRQYVRRFAAACRAASCDGLVLSGQLPYNANWYTYGPERFNAMKEAALDQGLGFVDIFYPVGGPSLAYSGGEQNPHLQKSQYVAQADYLWDNLLGLV